MFVCLQVSVTRQALMHNCLFYCSMSIRAAGTGLNLTKANHIVRHSFT